MKLKKTIKIAAIILLLFVGTLIAAPLLFKDKIKAAVLTAINENLTAKVTFDDVNLSLLSSFPKATLTLDDVLIINNVPFENDTLLAVKKLGLSMAIGELFKGENEAINISSIKINEAYLNLISNEDGIANYDIVKPSEDENSEETSNLNFSLEEYEISNSIIKYTDEAAHMLFVLNEFNHSGSGDLSAEQSKLDTKSSTKISFDFDDVHYLENNKLTLDALIGIDLKTNTYSFLNNEANISGLPLTFEGSVVMLENGQQIDLSFKTPTASFKNFLAIMPRAYASNLDNVKTEGDFIVNGTVQGINNDERIPNFNLNIASNNASFKYPDLPKSVDAITIKALVKNETGILDDTYVVLDALNFKIDQDVFKSNATIKNITTNPLVNAKLNGTINLANISNAYPFKMEEKLNGILKMDIATNFDMDAVNKSKYERIKSNGTIALSDFIYNGTAFLNPFNIKAASINFTPEIITLKQFAATTGKTDIAAMGTLSDVIGFVISNKPLKGNFNLTSNTFSVNDFMSDAKTEEATTTEETPIKIPAFLDCTIAAEAKTVLYDNLELHNLKGKMLIKDEKVTFEEVTSSLLGGNLKLNGNVSTKEATPTFNMDLGMNSFDIANTFEKLDLVKALIPIASLIQGKLNATLNFSGDLNKEFTPNLSSISGNALAQLLTKEFDAKSSVLLSTMASQLKFIDLNKLDLKDLKTKLEFENGKVQVKPFTINYEDIAIDISGAHGFDNSMDYKATFMVPAKYLGNEITGLMAKYSTEDASKLKVPVTAIIGGNFDKPVVTTDYKSAVSSLATQLVDVNKLKGQGANMLTSLIKQQTAKSTDTVQTSEATPTKTTIPSTQQKALDTLLKTKLNSLLGGKKKKKDTIN